MCEESSLYEDALDTWGLQVKVDQSIEELAELIVALEGDDREAVIDELADVQLMVDQLAIAFDQDAVDERVAEKQERLRDRIDDARLATDGGQPVGSESAESSVTTQHAYPVGAELEKIDSSIWKITNRMVDVDTGETLYRLREADTGPANYTQIMTESQLEQSFKTDGEGKEVSA